MISGTTWLIILWLFALGAAVGSFLNVVIYRLPNGLSLVYPPSHCPKCNAMIRWYDNVPIFGWIKLHGKCRNCACPISARYPIIETLTCLMFGLVAIVELPEMILAYPSHVVLLSTLLCAAMIEYDGSSAPFSLFVPSLLVTVAMQAKWPEIRPDSDWWGLSASTIEVVNGIGAVLLAAIFALAVRGAKKIGYAMSLTCIAVALGWQAVCILAALSLALSGIGRISRLIAKIPSSMLLTALTFAWILVAPYLVLGWEPG